MCDGVTDEEVYESYEILSDTALEGGPEALKAFESTIPPDRLKSNTYDTPIDQPVDEFYAMHIPPVKALLKESVADGNVWAAQMLALRY